MAQTPTTPEGSTAARSPERASRRGLRALVIGATGATGAQVVRRLLERPRWTRVTTLGRRPSHPTDTPARLRDIVVDSLHDLSSTRGEWADQDVFFNCIGTTLARAGDRQAFAAVEVGISAAAAGMAAEAGVPHASVISSIGADAGGRAPGWLHPLAYFRTMGEKEEATLQASALLRVSIFRPGKLTRTPTGGDRVLRALGLGLPVDVLAAAMVHDAEAAADSDRRCVVRHAGSSAIRRLAAQLVEA